MMNWIREYLQALLESLRQSVQLQKESNRVQTQIAADVAKLVVFFTPPLPVRFEMTVTNDQGEIIMAKAARGKLKLNILDNGTATATLGLLDAAGLSTSLPAGSTIAVTWVVSATSIVATPSADQMSAALAPSSPPALASGVTVSASGVITNTDGTTITIPSVSSEALNIIAGGPAGFSISVA
jgi:hypothetical protein